MKNKCLVILLLIFFSSFLRADITSLDGNIRFDAFKDSVIEMRLSGNDLHVSVNFTIGSNGLVSGNSIVLGNYGIGISSPLSGLHLVGSLGYGYSSFNTNSTPSEKTLIFIDTSGGALTLTLNNASDVPGRIYHVKLKSSSSNPLTISGNSSLIDGESSLILTPSLNILPAVSLVSASGNWYVFDKTELPDISVSSTWNGFPGSNGYASDPLNWLDGFVPLANTSIILNGGIDMIWDLNIPIQNWTQTADYARTVTMQSDFSTPLTVNGHLIINGGTWTHLDNVGNTSTSAGNRLYVVVGGDFTLGSSATIDVDGKGLTAGLGDGGNSFAGGAHGGTGNHPTSPNYNTYNRMLAPYKLGSGGGGGTGGGAVYLQVTGDSSIDGCISARGMMPSLSGRGGGAGGSIYLETASISGSGNFEVQGGAGALLGNQMGGGGGRIAVILKGSSQDFSVYTGNMIAYGGDGGDYDGGNGTVYQEAETQSGSAGNLIINNDSLTATGNLVGADGPPTKGSEDLVGTGNIQVYVYPNSRLIINSGDFHVGSVTDEGGDIVLGSGNLWLHD